MATSMTDPPGANGVLLEHDDGDDEPELVTPHVVA